MMRIVLGLLLFFLFSTIEVSFLHSLPGFLAFIPLVFALSIYLVQHHGLVIGLWWMIGYGLLLDLFFLHAIPFTTLAATAMAGATYLLSERVFSNRSVYGVLGCGMTAYAVYLFVEAIIQGIVWVRQPARVDWSVFLSEHIISLILLLFVIIVLFAFAGRIRSLLFQTFFLGQGKQTY